ncbi:MAG: DMT family transporter [Myxococcota bacterium]
MKDIDNAAQVRRQPLLPLGLGWALLGVIGFSGTVPAMRVAAPVLGPWFVALGRALIGGALAALILAWRRDRLPTLQQAARLVAIGVVFNVVFPGCVAIALQTVPAAHAAVIIGLAPASTAVSASLRTRTRLGAAQALGVLLGAVSVVAFAAVQSGGLRLERGDVLLLGAVSIVGAAYAEGGLLARADALGSGTRVTCWMLVLSLPTVTAAWLVLQPPLVAGTPAAWAGLAYQSTVSVLLASFAWYRGLASGDLARASQAQLVQPVLAVLWASWLLGEAIPASTALGAALVVAAAALAVRR